MVGTRQLAQVSDLVHQANGKLILIGDHHQLPEFEAGGIFRALANRLPAVELSENIRQLNNWERLMAHSTAPTLQKRAWCGRAIADVSADQVIIREADLGASQAMEVARHLFGSTKIIVTRRRHK